MGNIFCFEAQESYARNTNVIAEYVEQNAGGVEKELNWGVLTGKDEKQIRALYDRGFSKFDNIVKIGKRKFLNPVENSASTKEELLDHARKGIPILSALLDDFIKENEDLDLYYSSGENNKNMIKHEGSHLTGGLNFKLRWKKPSQITDVIRTTIICKSIQQLENAIIKFSKYCNQLKIDYNIVNFYENIVKWGKDDRYDKNKAFGYVGVHYTIPIHIKNDNDNDIIITAEIQFHPNTLYDGSDTSPKEITHEIYRKFNKPDADPLEKAKAKISCELYYGYAMNKFPVLLSQSQSPL